MLLEFSYFFNKGIFLLLRNAVFGLERNMIAPATNYRGLYHSQPAICTQSLNLIIKLHTSLRPRVWKRVEDTYFVVSPAIDRSTS